MNQHLLLAGASFVSLAMGATTWWLHVSAQPPTASATSAMEVVRNDWRNLDRSVGSMLVDLQGLRAERSDSLPFARTRTAVGPQKRPSSAYDALLARVEELRLRHAVKPQLVLSGSDVQRPSLLDVLYSASYFQGVIRSGTSTIAERATSFRSLAELPNAEIYFDEAMRQQWRQDVLLAQQYDEVTELAEVFSWVEPSPEDLPFYERLLTTSDVDGARAAAVNVLENRIQDDEDLLAAFQLLLDHDPSVLVRRRIEDALRERGLL